MIKRPVQLDLLDWLSTQAPAMLRPSRRLVPLLPTKPGLCPLTRIDLSCNMRRFYSVALATSLFGETGVVRQWGRIGTECQSRTDWYDGSEPAEAALLKLLTRKQQRGYTP